MLRGTNKRLKRRDCSLPELVEGESIKKFCQASLQVHGKMKYGDRITIESKKTMKNY